MRNQSQGWTRSSSNGSPAAANMAPSPLGSMTTRGGASAPDEPPAVIVLHQARVGVVPLGLRGVVDGAANLHAVHDLLAEAGDGLAAGAIVPGEEKYDEATGGEAAGGG